ncbi:hypothetical protein FFR93_30950 [Rhizobium sp. MHM7A]|nr:hypothetical protein FFR93_30950 [Rhizobium sp. MHM7A]
MVELTAGKCRNCHGTLHVGIYLHIFTVSGENKHWAAGVEGLEISRPDAQLRIVISGEGEGRRCAASSIR